MEGGQRPACIDPHQPTIEPRQQLTTMGHSLRDASAFVRPRTRDRDRERPTTSLSKDHGEHSLMIPSRNSSLHSRITQPIPSTLNAKSNQRTPKTLTHAYMVCGVGREPSQWVKAPAPAQGKIGHMKGAVGQFWLPEILGSSPRLEQDNENARALYAAMRVKSLSSPTPCFVTADTVRHASRMMLKSALAEVNRTVFITPSFSSKIPLIPCMALHCVSGQEQTRSELKRSGTCERGQRQTTTTLQTKHTGSLTV